MFWDPYMKMTRWQQDRQHRETEPSHCFHSLAAHTSNTARAKQELELLGVPDMFHRDVFDTHNVGSFAYFQHCTINDVIYLDLYFQCICSSL